MKFYIKRGCLVLEGFIFFSLYWFSCIASNSTTLKTFLTFVSVLAPRYTLRVQPSNIHIICPRPHPLHYNESPINAPDSGYIVNIASLLASTCVGTSLKKLTVIFRSAGSAAMNYDIYMCLHPANRWRYCPQPCSPSCWVDLAPDRYWMHICDDCVDIRRQLTGFDIRTDHHRSPYSNAKVRQ